MILKETPPKIIQVRFSYTIQQYKLKAISKRLLNKLITNQSQNNNLINQLLISEHVCTYSWRNSTQFMILLEVGVI